MIPADNTQRSAPLPGSQPAAPVHRAPASKLSLPGEKALAVRYAPILYFHPNETNFLQDPLTFIEQSTLRQELDFRPDRQLRGRGEVRAEELRDIGPGNRRADGQVFLDHQNETLGAKVRVGDLDNSRLLYEYDAQTNTLTYHLFYAYNNGPPGIAEGQNHEGDWERVTVQLDERYQPTAVRYSAHEGLNSERPWSEAPKEDGRPVVYVGQGSHANYPEPGTWATNVTLADDRAAPGGTRFDLAGQTAVDVTTEPYYGSHVSWGERGSLAEARQDWTSGPTGPSPDKGPLTDADPTREPLDGWRRVVGDGVNDAADGVNGPIGQVKQGFDRANDFVQNKAREVADKVKDALGRLF